LNAPTTWGNDMNTWLMGTSFVLSIAYAMSTDSHVRVDLLYNEQTRPRIRYFDLIGLSLITLPTVAWPIDAPFDKVYPDYPGGASIGGPANLAGVPGLFLPNGAGEAGLPTSLQLTGRALREHTLLAIGARYQSVTEHHRRRPPGL